MTRVARNDRLWTRDLVLASVVNLFLAFVFYLLMTTMALYAVERFSASDSMGGLASGAFVLGAVVARLLAGNVVDLLGRRRVLLVSLGVFVVASVAYLAAGSLPLLLGVRTVHGVAFGFASTAAITIAQSLIPAARRAEGTGYFTLSTTSATALGPFLALLLVHGPGYRALFLTASAAATVSLVAALLLRAPEHPPDAEEAARLRRFRPRDLLHPAVLPVAAFMLVLAVAFSGILTFLNSFAEDRGLQDGAGGFFLAYAVVLALARLVAGRVQDRWGANVVVHVALAGFATGLVLLATARTDGAVVVAGAFAGLGFGTLMSAIQAVAVGLVPPRRTGVAISTHFFMVDLGVGVGPVLLGALLTRLGYDDVYLLLAAVVVVSAGLYHLVHGRVERDERRRRSTAHAREDDGAFTAPPTL